MPALERTADHNGFKLWETTLLYAGGQTQALRKRVPVDRLQNTAYVCTSSGTIWLREIVSDSAPWGAVAWGKRYGFLASHNHMNQFSSQFTGKALIHEFLLATNDLGDLL